MSGPHAPIEVRQAVHRERLTAAAIELVEQNMPLTAEAICGQAKMSKATFYELFSNVEDFMPALLAAIQRDADAGVFSSSGMCVRWAAADAGVAISRAQAQHIATSLEFRGSLAEAA